jgi:hypothetical protein
MRGIMRRAFAGIRRREMHCTQGGRFLDERGGDGYVEEALCSIPRSQGGITG